MHAKLHDEFGGLVDKVAVTVMTEPAKVQALLAHAVPVNQGRDERVAGMTDESVDTFYSCTLCQSFAPNHVCVITPERLGLCGAYNWLDGQAAQQINPTGPNQPILKGRAQRAVRASGRTSTSSSTTTPTAPSSTSATTA